VVNQCPNELARINTKELRLAGTNPGQQIRQISSGIRYATAVAAGIPAVAALGTQQQQ
jgi:hypothetical protein